LVVTRAKELAFHFLMLLGETYAQERETVLRTNGGGVHCVGATSLATY
jgi:hypothetical protein